MLSDFPEERKWSPWARPLLPMIRQWSQLTDQLTTLLLINLRSCNNGQATKWNPTSTVPVVIPLQSLLQIWCSIIWWMRCNSDAAVGSRSDWVASCSWRSWWSQHRFSHKKSMQPKLLQQSKHNSKTSVLLIIGPTRINTTCSLILNPRNKEPNRE